MYRNRKCTLDFSNYILKWEKWVTTFLLVYSFLLESCAFVVSETTIIDVVMAFMKKRDRMKSTPYCILPTVLWGRWSWKRKWLTQGHPASYMTEYKPEPSGSLRSQSSTLIPTPQWLSDLGSGIFLNQPQCRSLKLPQIPRIVSLSTSLCPCWNFFSCY